MELDVRKWYVELVAGHGNARLFFGTWAPGHGHQVWDSVAYPLDWKTMTESEVLSELYDAVLVLMERRSTL